MPPFCQKDVKHQESQHEQQHMFETMYMFLDSSEECIRLVDFGLKTQNN